MSERHVQTIEKSDPPGHRTERTESIPAGNQDHARRLEEVMSELDSFAAEVSHELASIREVLSPSSAKRSHDGRANAASPEPSETGTRKPVNPSVSPPVAQAGRSGAEPRRPEPGSSAQIARPHQDLTRRHEASAAERVTTPSGEDSNGHDRLAALKMRLAAKLQTDGHRSPGVAQAADATTAPMHVEGTGS